MLQNIRSLYGKKLSATDGEIGHVLDFYFNDTSWAIRYIVVDTGSWLSGRQVLLTPKAFAPHVLEQLDADGELLQVNLSRKQIEESPSIDTHRPVSRQYEEEYHRYYGWQGYWQDGGMWSGVGFPVIAPPPPAEDVPYRGNPQRDDIHLRSMRSVNGYHIEATDGQIGEVTSFIVDSKTWAIRELVVETGHWYAGKTILLLPENIKRIDYEHSSVFVNLTKKNLSETTENDIALPGASLH